MFFKNYVYFLQSSILQFVKGVIIEEQEEK
jgi:hypothetical protein